MPPFDDKEERIKLDFIVVFPPETPKLNVVAAPPRFKVVTVEFRRLKDVAELVKSPPFTARSPVNLPVPSFSTTNLAVPEVEALINTPVEF